MLGLHALSTKPFTTNPFNSGKSFEMPKYALLVAFLSALMWKKLNGSIKLYTDTDGSNYLKSLGVINIWDAVDTDTLNAVDAPASPYFAHKIFWAASKIFAMAAEHAPFCMIDLDFIVWKKLNFPDGKTMAVHFEEITNQYYPAKEKLLTAAGYVWDASLDWSVLPANGAFVYHGNETLLQAYTAAALAYMQNNIYPDRDPVQSMVYAEQRLLSQTAKKLNIEIGAFWDFTKPFELQNMFTHIWPSKNYFNADKAAADAFCARLLNRIQIEFPSQYELISNAVK